MVSEARFCANLNSVIRLLVCRLRVVCGLFFFRTEAAGKCLRAKQVHLMSQGCILSRYMHRNLFSFLFSFPDIG
jgi:hypothetical protein